MSNDGIASRRQHRCRVALVGYQAAVCCGWGWVLRRVHVHVVLVIILLGSAHELEIILRSVLKEWRLRRIGVVLHCRVVIVQIHTNRIWNGMRLFGLWLLFFNYTAIVLHMNVMVRNNIDDPLAKTCGGCRNMVHVLRIKFMLFAYCFPYRVEVALRHLKLLHFLGKVVKHIDEFLRVTH